MYAEIIGTRRCRLELYRFFNHHRVIKFYFSSSTVLYIISLYHRNLECHPRGSHVTRRNIVACAPCFRCPARIYMLCPHLSSHIYLLYSMLQVYPVRSQFRHLHVSQWLSYSLAGSSLTISLRKAAHIERKVSGLPIYQGQF